MTDGNDIVRTNNLESKEKTKCTKVFDFECCVEDMFELLNAIEVVSRDYDVVNIDEENDALRSMEISKEEVI